MDSSIIKAHVLKKELDELRPLGVEQEQRIMQKFRLDWNYHSNHLEGNSLTFGETKALILFGITAQGKPLKDHFEITGHDEAIKWVEEVIKSERPLTLSFIRELHLLLLKEPYQVDAITPEGAPTKKWVKVGEYKTTPNHVKTKTGEIFRFATPEETPALMQDLLDWYKAEKEKPDTDPILLATEFHYRFIRIHPFDDGNGRTVRILMNFILMQNGYPPVIIKAEDKMNYLSVLQQADVGIFEPFVIYIADNLNRSLEVMIRGAKGESIEDPDDLDKEISLLETKLQSIGQRVEKVKSDKTLREFSEITILPAFAAFIESVNVFRKFFRNQSLLLIIGNSAWEVASPDIARDLILEKLDSNANQIKITITYADLNYVGFEEKGYKSVLDFSFNHNTSTVFCCGFESTKLYTEALDESEISSLKRLVKLYGKTILEKFIKEKESGQA